MQGLEFPGRAVASCKGSKRRVVLSPGGKWRARPGRAGRPARHLVPLAWTVRGPPERTSALASPGLGSGLRRAGLFWLRRSLSFPEGSGGSRVASLHFGPNEYTFRRARLSLMAEQTDPSPRCSPLPFSPGICRLAAKVWGPASAFSPTPVGSRGRGCSPGSRTLDLRSFQSDFPAAPSSPPSPRLHFA